MTQTAARKPNPRAKGRSVQVIGIDPGSTTGVCVIDVKTTWLKGMGAPTFEALGACVGVRIGYQLGRDPRTSAAGPVAEPADMDEWVLPIVADQPLLDPRTELRTRSGEKFYRILDGDGPMGGGPLNTVDAGEVVQVRQLNGLLASFTRAAVVIEDFNLRTEVTSREVTSPDRLRLAIMSHELMHGAGRVPFLQSAGQAKTTVTDDQLKRAGLYFKGMRHANDAARHALYFLRAARQREDVRAAAWPKNFKSFE